jgi:hypothetical protein
MQPRQASSTPPSDQQAHRATASTSARDTLGNSLSAWSAERESAGVDGALWSGASVVAVVARGRSTCPRPARLHATKNVVGSSARARRRCATRPWPAAPSGVGASEVGRVLEFVCSQAGARPVRPRGPALFVAVPVVTAPPTGRRQNEVAQVGGGPGSATTACSIASLPLVRCSTICILAGADWASNSVWNLDQIPTRTLVPDDEYKNFVSTCDLLRSTSES